MAVFPSKNKEIVERFTASKTDAFVPVGKFYIKFSHDSLSSHSVHGKIDTILHPPL